MAVGKNLLLVPAYGQGVENRMTAGVRKALQHAGHRVVVATMPWEQSCGDWTKAVESRLTTRLTFDAIIMHALGVLPGMEAMLSAQVNLTEPPKLVVASPSPFNGDYFGSLKPEWKEAHTTKQLADIRKISVLGLAQRIHERSLCHDPIVMMGQDERTNQDGSPNVAYDCTYAIAQRLQTNVRVMPPAHYSLLEPTYLRSLIAAVA